MNLHLPPPPAFRHRLTLFVVVLSFLALPFQAQQPAAMPASLDVLEYNLGASDVIEIIVFQNTSVIKCRLYHCFRAGFSIFLEQLPLQTTGIDANTH